MSPVQLKGLVAAGPRTGRDKGPGMKKRKGGDGRGIQGRERLPGSKQHHKNQG